MQQMLREIPVGDKASYTGIAKRMGSPKPARSVTGAYAAHTFIPSRRRLQEVVY